MASTSSPLEKPLKIILGNLVEEHPLFRLKYLGYDAYIHQAELFYKIATRIPIRALIADEVGLGKTIEALLLIEWGLRKKFFNKGRVLVLVPRSLIGQWEAEAKRFKLHPSIDIETLEEKYKNPAESMVFIFKIDTAKRDKYKEKILQFSWDLIVVDEVHKLGIDSQRMKLVKELVERNPGASILFLSATPHRGDDATYFEILSMLDPRIKTLQLRNYEELYKNLADALVFRRSKIQVNRVYEAVVDVSGIKEERVFVNAEATTRKVEIKQVEKEYLEKLDMLTKEIIYRSLDKRLKQSIGLLAMLIDKRGLSSPYAGLKTFENILRSLSEEVGESRAKVKYIEDLLEEYGDEEYISDREADTLVEDAVKQGEPRVRELLRDFSGEFEELSKLAKKVVEEDSKIQVLHDILLKHLENGDKVIVFTEFADTADYISSKLEKSLGYPLRKITGRDLTIRSEDTIEKVKEWLSEPSPRVLVSTDVASEGLNLQYANVVVNYELPWSLIKLEQRTGRVWRLGQSKDVEIYLMILEHSFEEKIFNALYRKLANSVKLGVVPSTLIALKTREGLELPFSGIIISRDLTPFKIWEIFKQKGEKGVSELVEENLAKLKKQAKKLEKTGLYTIESISPKKLIPLKEKMRTITGFETRREFEDFLYQVLSKLGFNYDEYWVKKALHESIRESEGFKNEIPLCIFCERYNDNTPLVVVKACINHSDHSLVCWIYMYEKGEIRRIRDLAPKLQSIGNCVEINKRVREKVLEKIDLDSVKTLARKYVMREVMSKIQESLKNYFEYVGKAKSAESNNLNVDAKPLLVIVNRSIYNEANKIIEEEIKKEIQDTIWLSEITHEKMEVEAKGRMVFEKLLGDRYVSLTYIGDIKAPFDYIAVDKATGKPVVIELKTLEKLEFIVLTENEYIFANRVSDPYEYWIYVVDFKGGDIKIRGYKNPFKSNKLRLYRTIIDTERREYYIYEETEQADFEAQAPRTIIENINRSNS